MTAPHYEERWPQPSAVAVWLGLGFLSWSMVVSVLHVTGVLSWFG